MSEIPELKPRNQCEDYMISKGLKLKIVALLRKQEFDEYAKAGKFSDGPHRDSFGDGHGEPYNPYRQAFGQLKTGVQSDNGEVRFVFCELGESFSEDLSKRVEEHITKQGRLINLIQENKSREVK